MGRSLGDQEPPQGIRKRKNPGNSGVLITADGVGWEEEYTPLDSKGGSVLPSKTRGETGSGADEIGGVVTAVVTSGQILDPSTAELLEAWNGLDDSARKDLLAIARGLASTRQRGNTR